MCSADAGYAGENHTAFVVQGHKESSLRTASLTLKEA